MKRSALDHAVRVAGDQRRSGVVASRSTISGSKAVAMRPKDIEFCRALATRQLVAVDTLRQRLADLTGIAEEQRAQIAAFIDSVSAS
jgi:hypothetical protein